MGLKVGKVLDYLVEGRQIQFFMIYFLFQVRFEKTKTAATKVLFLTEGNINTMSIAIKVLSTIYVQTMKISPMQFLILKKEINETQIDLFKVCLRSCGCRNDVTFLELQIISQM